MRRLHWKFYLAIVGTLMMFLVAIFIVWHAVSSPIGAAWGVESATRLTANLLVLKPRTAPDGELIDTLAYGLNADIVLVASDGRVQLAAMSSNFQFTDVELAQPGWHLSSNPTFGVRLDDGRLLVVHPHHRLLLHGLHLSFILIGVAAL